MKIKLETLFEVFEEKIRENEALKKENKELREKLSKLEDINRHFSSELTKKVCFFRKQADGDSEEKKTVNLKFFLRRRNENKS